MAVLSYTVSGSGAGTGGSLTQQTLDQLFLFGKDIYFDVHEGNEADTHVTPSGDYLTVEGREALRQSLIRRLITDPGEWAYIPEYGAGLRSYVKERRTPERVAEMKDRCRTQALRDPRVATVDRVEIENFEGGCKILLVVSPKAGPARAKPVTVLVEIT